MPSKLIGQMDQTSQVGGRRNRLSQTIRLSRLNELTTHLDHVG